MVTNLLLLHMLFVSESQSENSVGLVFSCLGFGVFLFVYFGLFFSFYRKTGFFCRD